MPRAVAAMAVVVFALLVSVCDTPTCAAPVTGSFVELRAELQRRHDADYAGTLTKAQRKELAAINACLARIDGAHATVGDDAKSLKFVAKKLTKAFRGEFSGSTPGTLPGLLAGTVTALLSEAETVYGTLDAALESAVGPQDPALALAAAARAALDEAALPSTTPAAAAALVRSALQKVAKGLTRIRTTGATELVCKIAGRTYRGTGITGLVTTVGGVPMIYVNAQLTNPVTHCTETFALILQGDPGLALEIGAIPPFGNGNYSVFTFGDDPPFYSQFASDSVGTITSFDETAQLATGTFSCRYQRDGRDRLFISKGSFTLNAPAAPGGASSLRDSAR